MEMKDLDEFIKTDEGKHWLQDKTNAAATKAGNTRLDNFKKTELPALIDDEIKIKYPDLAITEEQKKFNSLETKFNESEKKRARAEISDKLLRHAQDNNIPRFLADVSITDDYDASLEKLNKFNDEYNVTLADAVESKIKPRKTPIRDHDDTEAIDINNLPNDDVDFYEKNMDKIDAMLLKTK